MSVVETTSRITLIIVLICLSMPVSAAQVENMFFPDRYVEDNIELKIRGTGLLRYMVFVKAYAGGLYLPEEVPSDDALTEVPKRLEVEYFHAIKGKDFGPATRKMIAKMDNSFKKQLLGLK